MVDKVGVGSGTLGGATLTGTGHIEWWNVVLTYPTDAAKPNSTSFTLVVTATTWDANPVNVQVQVSTVVGFGSTVFDSTIVNAPGTGAATASINVSGLVDGTKYYWRARTVPPGGYTEPWTTVRSFTIFVLGASAVQYSEENMGLSATAVSPYAVQYNEENIGVILAPTRHAAQYNEENIGVAVARVAHALQYVEEGDVNTLTPTPAIWFLDPDFGRPGDGILIVGFGFGDTQAAFNGIVQLDYGPVTGWVAVSVTSWQTFPATANAYTAARLLDPSIPYVDMQHQSIGILIPFDALPPGYPVRVRTDGP